ncbi:MAG: THUMP domain-containing protein [Prevotellaceae bacterium]|jgi:putative N6-adenine-specific DNA methylase|nr:THUMP domain-containing protein [Prevotellaceae bacterium]
MKQTFNMIAKTFQGLEEVLATELINLEADNVEIQRRAVSFTGDLTMLYKANLHLRTASRVLKPILVFTASNAEEVYEQVKKINWDNYLKVDSTFSVDSTVYSDSFRHSKFVVYKVKDAIADWFNEKYDRRPSVSLTAPQLIINIHISQTACTLSLDSSGESLHKRGYRVAQTDAPINEALAAGMLLQAGWKGETDLIDPMCGSGTLLIEAALIAQNIPPGIYRKEFAFERWHDFDEELFESLYNDDSRERPFTNTIYGSDISPKAIKSAEQNVKSAGLGKYIKLQIKAFQELEYTGQKALIVTNPPYGERIVPNDIYALYGNLGTLLKHQFNGSTAWVISSSEEALKKVGLKPDNKIKLMNGALECFFCGYTVFPGKRNDFIKNENNDNSDDENNDNDDDDDKK